MPVALTCTVKALSHGEKVGFTGQVSELYCNHL